MKTKRIIYNTAVRFVQEIRTAAANMRTLGTSRFHTRRFRYNNRVLMALAISRAQGTVIVTDNTRRYTDMPGVVHTPKFFAALRNVKKR